MPARPRDASAAARAPPSQPRPWLGSDPRMNVPATPAAVSVPSFNADVLEVITEYACGTVADACALRGSCKGYRRAVDTTVRRLVYEDQPELREGSSETPLQLHRDSGGLDVVDKALSSDEEFWCAAPRIIGIVVVAFALDGPKDKLHEGDACGERPVVASDWNAERTPFTPRDDDELLSAPSDAMRGVLQRCMTHAYIEQDTETSVEGAATVEALAAAWPRLASLHFGGGESDPINPRASQESGLSALSELLHAIGPQLHTLHIDMGIPRDAPMIDGVCPAIARCGNLKSFEIDYVGPKVSGRLCDALLASGAPLEDISVPGLARKDAVRLIEATATIHTAHVWDLEPADLSARALGRLRMFNESEIATNEVGCPKQP